MAQVLPTFYESFSRGQRDALDFQTAVEEEKRRKAAEQRLQQMFPLEMQGKEYNNQYMREIGRNVGYKNEYEGQTLQQRIAAEIAAQQAAAAKSGIEKGYYTDSQELIRLAGEEAAAAGGNAASARALQGLPGMFPQQMFEYTQNPRVTANTSGGAGTTYTGGAGTSLADTTGYTSGGLPAYLADGYGTPLGGSSAAAPAPAPAPIGTPAPTGTSASVMPGSSVPLGDKKYTDYLDGTNLYAPIDFPRPEPNLPEGFWENYAPKATERFKASGDRLVNAQSDPEALGALSANLFHGAQMPVEVAYNEAPKAARWVGGKVVDAVGDFANKFYSGATGITPAQANTPPQYPQSAEALYNPQIMGEQYAPPAEPQKSDLQTVIYNALINRKIDPKLAKAMLEKDARLNFYPGTTAAIAFQESSLDPYKVNPKSGAAGLMQIMPMNWTPYGGENFNYADPYQSLDVYEKLMRERIKRYGIENLDSILRAYNGNMDLSSKTEENLQFPDKIRERFEQLFGFTFGSR